jgi:hypothetical protein
MWKWFLLLLVIGVIAAAFMVVRSEPERAVEAYYQAASRGDTARLEGLSCSPEKTMKGPIVRMPDYAGENLRVAKMACNTIFREGGYAIVSCTSELYTNTTGTEKRVLTTGRSYHLSQKDGNWCVYGYNQP